MPSKLVRNVATHTLSAVVGAAVFSIAMLAQRNDNDEDNDDDANGLYNKESIQVQSQPQPQPQSLLNAQSGSRQRLSPLELIHSPITIWNPNPNLEIAFDARTKNPIYVLERLQVQASKSSNNDDISSNNKNSSSSSSNVKKKKRFQFYEHKSLAPHHRSKNGHYKKSGYDRGHLAPAADFNFDDSDTSTQKKYNNFKYHTFSLINASPQDPTFNRFVWLRLEEWVRKYVSSLGGSGKPSSKDGDSKESIKTNNSKENMSKDVYVISGPIWLPSSSINTENQQRSTSSAFNADDTYEDDINDDIDGPSTIVVQGQQYQSTIMSEKKKLYQYSYNGIGTPPSLVQVPTHFFKIVFTLSDRNGDTNCYNTNTNANTTMVVANNVVDQFAAFVIPNESFEKMNHIRLIDYVVKFKDLESVTGLTFFPTKSDHCDNDHDRSSVEVLDLVTELLWHEHGHERECRREHEQIRHNLNLAVDNYSNKNNTGTLKTLEKKRRSFQKRNNGTVLPIHICSIMACNEIMYLPRGKNKKKENKMN